MVENLKTNTENTQMQNLLDEVTTILKNSADLNKDKHKLGKLVDEIMYWTKEENQLYEDYYKNFCDTISAMVNLDFSKRLPEQDTKTLFSFMTLGLNVLNEELLGKVLSTKMLHSLLNAINIKNTTIVLTNASGQITFIHSGIETTHLSEEALIGQPMSVIIDNFKELDEKFKTEAYLKGVDVKVKLLNAVSPTATLRIAVPGLLSSVYEGVIYILTYDKQNPGLIKENSNIDQFNLNCSKFELTTKEKEIAYLLASGHSQKEIAERTFRSPHTIAKHIQNIFNKVGVKNKSDLMLHLKFPTR